MCAVPLLLLLITAACGEVRTASYVIEEPLTGVVVEGAAADVSVRAHAEEGAAVEARFDGEEPLLRVQSGVLYVTAQCDRVCDLEIAVPAAAELDVELGLGNVTVAGLAGDVAVKVGDGNLTLSELAGSFRLFTGAGGIHGDGLAGRGGSAEAHTGNVVFRYSDATRLETLSVDLSVGTVEVHVPAGAYDLRLSTPLGGSSVAEGIEDRDGDGFTRRIEVNVANGNIEVRPLS